MTDRFDAIVIGAGHNGLVCAAYLARAGLRVACVEARDAAGGMAAARTLANDYHFSGLAHAAFPVGPGMRRELGLDRHGYAPGRALDTVSLGRARDHLVIAAEAVQGTGLPDQDARRYPQFRAKFVDFARALRPLFESPPPRLKDLAAGDRKTLARLGWNIRVRLGRAAMYEFLRVVAINVHDVLDEQFEDDRLKGALAAEAVLGSAMGPRTPGSVLTWLQRLHGAPHGPLALASTGTGGLIDALTRSLEASGGSIRLGARVDRILTEDGAATGVALSNGDTLRAGLVVSNVDPRATFLQLVGAPRLDAMFTNRVRQIRGAGTVAKLHLALNDRPGVAGLDESLLGSRILVAHSMKHVEHAFNHSKYGEFSAEPLLEITIPSLHRDGLAPPGHHVMSVNVAFAPYALEGGWDGQREAAADRVVDQLERYMPGLRALIVAREFLTPADIETDYGAVGGHWHHGELSMHQSFMMRPLYGASQYDTPIDRLFLCGAGCHPGGGVTGIPGRNAARRVLGLGAER